MGGMEEKTAVERLMRATGRAFLTATTERQQAIEGYEGHGAFTHVLLEGMRGKADRPGEGLGEISIDELYSFLKKHLPKITKEKWGYEQIPMRSIHGDSFPIVCSEGFDKPGCKK